MTFKSLGRLQNVKRLSNFGRLPIKFWEAPKKKLGGSKIFRDPSQTISLSHILRCLAKDGIHYSAGFFEYKAFEILENTIGA